MQLKHFPEIETVEQTSWMHRMDGQMTASSVHSICFVEIFSKKGAGLCKKIINDRYPSKR